MHESEKWKVKGTLLSCVWLFSTPRTAAPRLPHPWDSPGRNTGVGCHFLLQCMKVKSFSRLWLFANSWTAAYQAPPSMGFSRQEYWRGLPFPSPGDLPDPGIKSRSPALQADSLLSEPPGKPPSGKFLDLLRGDNFCHRYSYIQVWRLPCELPDPCNSFLSLATG